jgi:hypothetical protein
VDTTLENSQILWLIQKSLMLENIRDFPNKIVKTKIYNVVSTTLEILEIKLVKK